jgi:hypothetical protein
MEADAAVVEEELQKGSQAGGASLVRTFDRQSVGAKYERYPRLIFVFLRF